jgi:hypothetical protein
VGETLFGMCWKPFFGKVFGKVLMVFVGMVWEGSLVGFWNGVLGRSLVWELGGGAWWRGLVKSLGEGFGRGLGMGFGEGAG